MHYQGQLSALLNIESFMLSVVILLCIMLSIVIGMLVWFQNKEYRYSAIYLIIILLIYQVSSLLAFYSPPDYFKVLILVKMYFSILLKSVVLVWLSDYFKNRVMLVLSLFLHLFSLALAWPTFFYTPFQDAIVLVSTSPNTAVYEQGARIYFILSSIIYIAASILFYLTSLRFRQSKRDLIFLLVFILFNTGLLFWGILLSSDVLYEKMHVFVLLVQLAIIFRLTSFIKHGDWIISPSNLLNGMVETAIILDRQDKNAYNHNGIESIDIPLHFAEIKERIGVQQIGNDKEQIMNKAHSEGRINIDTDKVINLNYKLAPLYSGKKLIGKIIVLRDMTHYTETLKSLNEKNDLLKEAVEEKNKYIKIVQRITGEEERGIVLRKVNKSMREYLSQLKKQVMQFEDSGTLSEEEFIDRINIKNKQMLELTRQVLYETRQSVKKLSNIK